MNCRAKVIVSGLLALISLAPLNALDFNTRIIPEVLIPLSNEDDINGKSLFALGGGGRVSADFEFDGFFAPFIEGAVHGNPGNGVSNTLVLSDAGLGLSMFFYPHPRFKIRIAGSGGLYNATYDQKQGSYLYFRAGTELGYRFSPAFTLNLAGNYNHYALAQGTLLQGIGVGLSLDINFSSLGGSGTGLEIRTEQKTPVFPILYESYSQKPLGTLILKNTEQAEIRNVSVSFQAGTYTSGPKLSARVSSLAKGETVELPLFASFNDQLLTLTENSKVQSEIVVTYSLLDSERTVKKAETISFNHRNAFTWQNSKISAAFISPNDPTVLEYSKFVAGLIRDKVRSEIEQNLQYGLGLFESFRLSGLTYSPDPTTPYSKFHKNAAETDYLQYPFQTLAYKNGDSDDLAVLYAASLQAVGISSALVFFDDEACVAFPLSMPEADVRSNFLDARNFVFADGKAWVVVQPSLIREGFMRAWLGASKKWYDALDRGEKPEFIATEEGWKAFPAVGIPGIDERVPKPGEEQLTVAFDNTMNRFIAREIGPRVQKLQAEILGGASASRYNALGVLYARYGLLNEAKAQFELAAKENNLSALTNLGNIAFLQKNYELSLAYFEEVLKIQPGNKVALLGLARAKYELNDFSESDELFSRVQKIDPNLASRYSYLSSRVESPALRASSAADRTRGTPWGSGE